MKDFKAIIFNVGNAQFGMDIQRVFSIDRMDRITILPNLPPYMKGVADLRGEVVPVMDLRYFLSEYDYLQETSNTQIITIKIHDRVIGLIVDIANDVVDISSATIQKPDFHDIDLSFVLGISIINEDLLILLDIDNLLSNAADLEELLQRLDV
ncbi:chemotaxis protein CheW [Domibacillus tundrae]|uniref:chemotaxis protein CheW n=1 Tax=Domibacillus tundrae TaxID=1587527 RepID=UPI0006182E2C|nr:chemotaxis protein CheW [Domibacillus tundrae]